MAIPKVHLARGPNIPQIGLGLWRNTAEEQCKSTVRSALKIGYRHFDTAQIYGNENYLGQALKQSGVSRKDLFITTKISVKNFWRVRKSFDQSLEKLQTDYVDLLLLHFPVPGLRKRAWRKLEAAYDAGTAHSIGVSNYTINHLEKLLKNCRIKPAVNQVELHIYLQQPELVAYCKKQGIALEAYSPLAHGYGMDDPVLVEIANKHQKSSAQIMIRWCIEQDWVVLPKTVHAERLRDNIDVFDFSLDDKDRKKLKGLNKGLRTCWNPTYIP